MKNSVTETKNQQPGMGFSPYLSLDQSKAKNRFSPEPRTGRRGGKSIEIWDFLLDLSRRPRSPIPNLAPKTQSPAAVVDSSSPLTVAARRSQVRSRPLLLPLPPVGFSPSPLLDDFGFFTGKKNRRYLFHCLLFFVSAFFIAYYFL